MIKENTDFVVKQSNVDNCNFVKTILMIIIVIYHSIVFWTGNWFTANPIYSSNFLRDIALWLNSFHVYTFVMVSGYIYAHIRFNGGYERYISFIKVKIKRLLVPYVFVACTWVIPIQYAFFHYDVKIIVTNYVLGTNPNQLWFLLMLFDVFLIVWPLNNFLRKHNIIGIMVVGVTYLLGIVGDSILPNYFMIWTACGYIPFFWIGLEIYQYNLTFIYKIPSWVLLIFQVCIFGICNSISTREEIIFKCIYLCLLLVLHAVGTIMAFAILQKAANKFKNNKTILRLSRRSMIIYLYHQQIIYFFIAGLNGKTLPYANAIINFAGTMLITFIISTLLLKFKITRLLVGEKV